MQELFRKYLDNQCSPGEVKELLAYFNAPENDSNLRQLIMESLEAKDLDGESNQWVGLTDEVFIDLKKQLHPRNGKLVPIYRRTWVKIAAAAVIVGAIAGITFITDQPTDTVKANTAAQAPAEGHNKAILTLADGSSITLETAATGVLARQGNASIVKQANGKLAYKLLNEKPTDVVNSIVTPRGGQYQLVLSDGTIAWLNAASSLRFPATFTGKERKVKLTGEAYFEVAHNAGMPFKVEVSDKEEVEVLGTHFNVNAYADEAAVKTTLVEGKVKVTVFSTRESRLIAPGEQAQVSSSNEIVIHKKVDLDQAIAWKNGAFNFQNADLRTVFRQISRWYDVDVEFQKQPSQRKFNGEIQRDLKLVQVLKILEKNKVFCRLDGKKLVVQ